MQKLTMALLISMTAANMVYADCASDLKKFNDSKAFVLENAKTVSEVANELNTAITAEITIDNTKLFAGTVTKLDTVANQIKKNRDALSASRASYQAAKCSAAAPAETAPATEAPAQ